METFTEAATLAQAGWANLKTREQRAEAMAKIANDRLAFVGVPPVAHVVKALGGAEAGSFNFENWTLQLDKEIFEKAVLTDEDAADMAETVYHEARHAEQWFMMAQMRAGQGLSAAGIAEEMTIPARIAALAKAKPLARGSMEALEAFGWFDNIYGSGRERRRAVLIDAEQKGKALKAAKAADEKESTSATKARLEAAQKAFDTALERYKDLPEEFDGHFVAGRMREIFEANQP
jgi:hypothetical protein